MAKYRKGYKYFSSSDLAVITRNTNKNYHLENLIFVAKKTRYPTVTLKRIKERRDRRGYLVDPHKTDLIREDLMIHIGNVLDPMEYEAVRRRM